MLSFLYFYVAVFLFNSVNAQIPIPDGKTCDQLCNSTRNLDPRDITGIFFISYQIPNFFMNASKCIYLDFTKVNNSLTTLKVYERRVEDNSLKLTDGYMTFSEDGSVVVKYTNLELFFPFKLIAFDLDAFALIQCRECGVYSKKGRGIYAHILTRIPYPTCDSLDRLLDAMEGCGVPRDAIPMVDHSSCQESCS